MRGYAANSANPAPARPCGIQQFNWMIQSVRWWQRTPPARANNSHICKRTLTTDVKGNRQSLWRYQFLKLGQIPDILKSRIRAGCQLQIMRRRVGGQALGA